MSEPGRYIQIEWDHPHIGRISEIACPRHHQEVFAALRLLGIGNGGRYAPANLGCLRCENDGAMPRVFLNALPVDPGSDDILGTPNTRGETTTNTPGANPTA